VLTVLTTLGRVTLAREPFSLMFYFRKNQESRCSEFEGGRRSTDWIGSEAEVPKSK